MNDVLILWGLASSTSAIGDLIYGYVVICIFKFTPVNLLLFTLLSITGSLILAAFATIAGSFSFWIIRGDMLHITSTIP